MNRILLVGFLLLMTLCCLCQNSLKIEMDYQDEKFEVGQIWNYETRKGEENSTIQIVKIDKYENEEAFIHISVKGLKMKNPEIQGGISKTIGHLPFTRKSILESVTKMVNSKDELSDFEDGYQNWKEAFEAEKGGVFTISVSEAVKYVEDTMKQ